MTSSRDIFQFIRAAGWLPDLQGPESVSFLAAGEYNENWKVNTPSGTSVFRINHGSQLGLADQIGYEFAVLQAVAPSGVTPRPFHAAPGAFGTGALLMEYLPGRPLDYATDLQAAAEVFARIHALPPDERLLIQREPMEDIARESWGLLHRHPDHPRHGDLPRLLDLHAEIAALARENASRFQNDSLVMANTEVNSGNFIVDNGRTWLVDWEKAVTTSRHQDLGHFIAPTTTLWKAGLVLAEEDKLAFLDAYLQATGLDTPLEEARELARLMERTILLRGLSWCYMAYHEYAAGGRSLANPDTFSRIVQYLEGMEWLYGLTN